jgi:hypothetical protein
MLDNAEIVEYSTISAASTIRAPRPSNADRLAYEAAARLSRRATSPSSMVTLVRAALPLVSNGGSPDHGCGGYSHPAAPRMFRGVPGLMSPR